MISLIFINLTVLLLIAIAVLHFSDLTSDPRWEILCGKALLFSIVPVIIPFELTLVIWAIMLLIMFVMKKKKDAAFKHEMDEQGAWKCRHCGNINQRLNVLCWKCGNPRE